MPNAQDVLDSMEHIDSIQKGDVVYVPAFGCGIVYDWYELNTKLFKIMFHDKCLTYRSDGNMWLKEFAHAPYDKETSVSRFDSVVGRRLQKGTQVFNWFYGMGTVINAFDPDNEDPEGVATIYFPATGTCVRTNVNGIKDGINHSVALYASVFPMDNFKPFGHSSKSMTIAILMDRMREKEKELKHLREALVAARKERGDSDI